MGSLALATKGQYMTGVSTDIGTSFVRPGGKPGDTLLMKSVLTGMGRQSLCSPCSYVHLVPLCVQANPWHIQGLTLRTHLVNWLLTDVGRLIFLDSVLILHARLKLDHTKYIGKSSSHPVSTKAVNYMCS